MVAKWFVLLKQVTLSAASQPFVCINDHVLSSTAKKCDRDVIRQLMALNNRQQTESKVSKEIHRYVSFVYSYDSHQISSQIAVKQIDARQRCPPGRDLKCAKWFHRPPSKR